MSDFSGSDNEQEDVSPTIDVVYPVNEETEVPNTSAGLFKTVLAEGKGGKPPTGAKVIVHYTGTLASNGEKFDSSRDRGEPFEFTIGKGQVIQGWDKGVATMRKGERAILKCLPNYAYGANGSPPKIPGNSTLNFDVELIRFTKREDVSKAKDGSIEKEVRQDGRDYVKPGYESEVTISIAIVEVLEGEDEADGAVLVPEHDLKFVIGEHPDDDFPEALEEAIESLKKGETSAIDVGANRVTRAYPALQVCAGQGFRAIVTLKDFTKLNVYDVKGDEKISSAATRKEQGNGYFVKGNWHRAIRKYQRALEFIESDFGLDDNQKLAAKKVKVPVYSNMAQANINVADYDSAVKNCTKCLELDGSNVKALYRRAKVNNLLGEWEVAKVDLKKALELDPSNADCQREWASVAAKEQKQRQLDKARYGNMFAKMAAMEEKEASA